MATVAVRVAVIAAVADDNDAAADDDAIDSVASAASEAAEAAGPAIYVLVSVSVRASSG